MAPNCKAEKYFLFDVDTKEYEDIFVIRGSIEDCTNIVSLYETANGYHFITEPFNPNEFMNLGFKNVEIKKDAMMLLAY